MVWNENVSCECGLIWTGLKRRWSQMKCSWMNRSQMNVVSNVRSQMNKSQWSWNRNLCVCRRSQITTAHRSRWIPTRVRAVIIHLHSLYQGSSNFFCQRTTKAITQQFEGRTSCATTLFRDMLHSTKSTNFRMHIIFKFFTKYLCVRMKWLFGPDETPSRAGFGPRTVFWKPLIFMDWIDSSRRIEKGATIGIYRIIRLLLRTV